MALILAIEPDRKQASKVAAIVKNRLHAEIVSGDTTEHAVEALGGRVPDLILTSLLLSPKDDARLADWLRDSDEAGRHVQTLVIPVLGGSARDFSDDGGGGLLSRFTRGRSRDDSSGTDGCDPEIFATQIHEYLERAAEERRAEAERLEDMEAAREAAAAAGQAAAASDEPAAEPVYEPAYGESFFSPPQRADESQPAVESTESTSWTPYSEQVSDTEPAYFEVEAVATEAMDAAPVDAETPAEAEEDETWSEISLGSESEGAHAIDLPAYARGDDDEDTRVELTSEPIDLQRFVEELSTQGQPERASRGSKDDVLAEFEEALETITEPNRPNGASEADSEVLTPLGASAAWPQLDSTVAAAAAEAASQDTATPPPTARRPKKKKARMLAPQDEWSPFDPEQCGFGALLAKLDKMAAEAKPEKPGR